MTNITVSNRLTNIIYNIGAIICRTPKTLNDTSEKLNRCVLITSTTQLVYYFGDPFIDPSAYSDLIIAYRLVSAGFPIYISSLYEMKSHNDGFVIPYNGYTEFYFKDKNGYKTIGYKLKSELKFCQPIIQSDYNSSTQTLIIHASLYLLERDIYKPITYINKINPRRLYTTYSISFNTTDLQDSDIINALTSFGLELKILNNASSTSFIDELKSFSSFRIINMSDENSNYTVNFHSDDYDYDFYDDDKINFAYNEAIERFKSVTVLPHILCLGKLYRSHTLIEAGHIVRSYMEDLDTYNYSVIYNYLLQTFDEECDTYLIINSPDVSISTALDFFAFKNDYESMLDIPSQYNCDAFYGYACDFVKNSLYYSSSVRVYYSAAILSFYNLIYKQQPFLVNSIEDLGIACSNIKSLISKDSADALISTRCNSIVTFDKGYPSIYGNKSLSKSANLQYNHISRNFIYIRRLIREKLESIKFVLNMDYNLQLTTNYIKYNILQSFKESGVLKSFTVSYNIISTKSVAFDIRLQFNGIIESIILNFTI